MDTDKQTSLKKKEVSSRKQWKIRLFAAFTIIETFLFAGIFFGWGSLLFVFQEEGIYAELCKDRYHNFSTDNSLENFTLKTGNNTSKSCPVQDRIFNLWFSIATGVGSAVSVLTGYINGHFGEKKTKIMFLVVFVAWAMCLAFTSPTILWLILPGLTLIYIGGYSILITSLWIARFLNPGGSIFIGLLNGMFDSSAVMMRVLKALHENGIHRKYTFIGLSVLRIVMCGAGIFMSVKLMESEKIDKEIETTSIATDESKSANTITNELEEDTANTGTDAEEPQQQQKDKATRHYLFSSLYIIHVLYESILFIHYVFFLGYINRKLHILTENKEKVGFYTDVLSYTLFGGIIGSFVCGAMLECQKKYFFPGSTLDMSRKLLSQVFPLSVSAVLGILLSTFGCIPSTSILYALFAIFMLYRSCLFTVHMGYIICMFPTKVLSVLYGMAMTVMGILSLFQYVLFTWIDAYENGLYDVEWFIFAWSLLSLIHPAHIFIRSKRTTRGV